VFGFTSVVSADEDGKKKEGKMKDAKPEVVSVEVAGVVEKKETGEKKPMFYAIKNAEGKLVPLKNKVGGKEVDLEQYVGKSVVAKGKGTIITKNEADGKEYKKINFTEIASIEVAGDSAPKAEEKKPEEKK
jgi:hypothetical protein